MAAADHQRLDLVRGQIVGHLFAADARRGLDGGADDEFVAVGQSAVDAARVVGRCRAFDVEERVVVLGAAHARPGEAAAEFHALDGGNREEQVGDHAFGRVEEGLSQPQRNALHAAFDDAAYGVLLGGRGAQHLVETLRVGAASDLRDAGVEGHARRQYLLGDHACGRERHGQAGREVAAAARVVEAVEFVVGHHVGVRGPVVAHHVGVVLRVGVAVGELDGQRGARGHAVVESRHDLRDVGFAARRGAARAAAPACEVGFEILRRKRNACRNAVDRDADLLAVRLAPDGEPEVMTENVHGFKL